MSFIKVRELSFTHEGSYDPVFESVSFHMDSSWRLGLVGRNGRGKTTLLRLLLGELSGTGEISSALPFAYFPYPVPRETLHTRQILEGLCPFCEEWEYVREISLLDVDYDVLDRPFETLSGGERTKVLLAALFLVENRFLLIDEPTNHLDEAARQTVAAYLKSKRGFILVSHDRTLLDQCTDHTMSIEPSGIQVQSGSYSVWRENQNRKEQFEQAEQQKLQGEAKRLEAASRRSSDWSDQVEKTKHGTRNAGLRPDRGFIGHKSAKMMKRAKSIQKRQEGALNATRELLRDVELPQTLKITGLQHHAEVLVQLRDFSVAFEEDRPLFSPVEFMVEQGDRVAILGRNGSGKSSLLHAIAGEEVPHTGQLQTASGLVISVIGQEAGHLRGSLRDYIRGLHIDETQCMTILRKLGFSRQQLEKDMGGYSQGQKKKVLLAGSLCQQAHFYIWDEPLNFVDIPSRLQIEQLILEGEPTLLFVEHDAAFQKRIATKTLELTRLDAKG